LNDRGCPFCGAGEDGPLPGGPCWKCLRGLAREEPAPDVLGDYEVLAPEKPFAEGGTGRVYEARHRVSGELVALKLARTGSAHEFFVRQARFESALTHPNIVCARLGPSHVGRPTLVMSFMKGGKLSEHSARRGPLEKRLELALKIARAVQSAHELGVLHCDIKSDNILLDAAGEPHLCDFGLARAVSPDDENVVVGGTRGWMSPEQVREARKPDPTDRERLRTSTDIFSLGVLLHWLVTGKFPFGEGADFERRVLEERAPALPRYTPDLGWGMLSIARRAMEYEPDARYVSAAAFANDLDLLRRHEPLVGVRLPAIGRAFRWAKRRPGARNVVLALLPCFAAATFFVVERQRDDLKQAILSMNAYAASGQAAAVLFQLRDYAEEVARAARLPGVQALVLPPRPLARDASGAELPNQDPCKSQTALADPAPLTPFRARFSTLFVLDSSGCARARSAEDPPSLAFMQRRYDWRSYFSDALPDQKPETTKLGVRKAYRSSVSQLIKFAVSSPIFDTTSSAEPAPWIGVLAGSLTVASTLELPRTLHKSGGATSDQVTAVLGPIELDARDERADSDFTFLAHPRLARGARVTAPPELEGALRIAVSRAPQVQFELPKTAPTTLAHYVDPLFGDRWLAALSPVGGTGYFVVVQTRESFAEAPSRPLARLGLALALISAALFFAWSAFAIWNLRAARRAEGNQ